jgi:membrane associated rhomboid family serine protease
VITYVLLGITIGISFLTWNRPELFGKLMMNPYQIAHRQQYYRFVTSGFIHKDHMHLFFNMFSFYFFGRPVEQIFNMIFGPLGNIYFIALYVVAIVVSDMPSYFKHRHDPGYNSLGASGAIAAVIFVYIIFQPLSDMCILVICMPGFILGALYIIFSYFQGRKANDNINHDAHLYGALFGLLFCAIFYPQSIPFFFQQISEWGFFEKISDFF